MATPARAWADAGLWHLDPCRRLLAGPLPALAANPISPKEATTEIGGQFTLVDQEGHTVTDAQFRGKWLLVYFGYTHCPDACPTALNDMAEALDQLDPAKRQKVQAIFITVDPERDTPAVMKDYVGAFEGANIMGLTGTPEQVSVAGPSPGGCIRTLPLGGELRSTTVKSVSSCRGSTAPREFSTPSDEFGLPILADHAPSISPTARVGR